MTTITYVGYIWSKGVEGNAPSFSDQKRQFYRSQKNQIFVINKDLPLPPG